MDKQLDDGGDLQRGHDDDLPLNHDDDLPLNEVEPAFANRSKVVRTNVAYAQPAASRFFGR
ncbi:MAG TPA: hypothetical protein VNV18_05710 [Stellaceae bacterium]|nr:hypothetical protein [Stellaceae bacterium]